MFFQRYSDYFLENGGGLEVEGGQKKKVVRERNLLWVSLSKRETLPVWTRRWQ